MEGGPGGDSASPGPLPSASLMRFVEAVTDDTALAAPLLAAARAEMGPEASQEAVDDRAGDLLLESMFRVGGAVHELKQRQRLFGLLRGDDLSPEVVQETVDYVLSQMVAQPKGAIAERLGWIPATELRDALVAEGRVPPQVVLKQHAWSRRIVGNEATPRFAEWRAAADFLLCATAQELRGISSVSDRVPEPDDLVVFGVFEVKSYRKISRRRLAAQIARQVARLAGGVEFHNSRYPAKVVSAHEPHTVWLASMGDAGEICAVCAADVQAGACPPEIVMAAIGPRSEAKPRRIRAEPFDRHLPLDEAELETAGVAIAYHMFDAMACQDEVDLVYWQWWDNIEAALNQAYAAGSPRRRRRIDRFVARFDRN